MVTKFDTNDKIWIMATVRGAQQYDGKIYYTIDGSDLLIPEDICRECSEEDISALRNANIDLQCAEDEMVDDGSVLNYSSRRNLVLRA